jgi:hypothetical protein
MIVVMLGVTLVYAVFLTINTNDGVIDSDWPSATPSPYVTDANNDAGGGNTDITAGYMATSGPAGTDFLYFRVDVASGSIAGVNQRLTAFIDCNNDGDFTDNNGAAGPTDLIVLYSPAADTIQIRVAATNALVASGAASDGEAVGSSAEWQVQKSVLTANGCTNIATSTIAVAFTSLNDTTITGPVWNSPTAIHLQAFQASGNTADMTAVAVFILLLLASMVAYFVLLGRGRRSQIG